MTGINWNSWRKAHSMNSIEEKKKNLTGNRKLNDIIRNKNKQGLPAIKVEETDSKPKTTAETLEVISTESKNGDLATWLEVTVCEINSSGEEEESSINSYFPPIINPQTIRDKSL